MPQINLLSPHVADLIAAGEVVERPASVVKELMENAFDAGARNVTVEIRNGGATLIRVTDDGCGMAPEDAGIAFLRHATSKLRDESGLEAIETMGFRGEALAAISAVSHVELITRRPEDAEGTRMLLTAGDIDEMEAVGCPAGTEITIRDLFFNTPARLKFLKSDRSEASACIQAAQRCALGRPEISVRFLRDGKEEFFTPGDGTAASCVYSLLGRELSQTLLPIAAEENGLSLTGLLSSPAAGRGNRGAQYFFCNGRFIRSVLLQSALEQAYQNTLLTGRYPACVVWLEISPGAVDVNVHPAKTEVKFSEERRVFHLLYLAARSALQQEDRLAAGQSEDAPVVPTELSPASAAPPASAGSPVSVSSPLSAASAESAPPAASVPSAPVLSASVPAAASAGTPPAVSDANFHEASAPFAVAVPGASVSGDSVLEADAAAGGYAAETAERDGTPAPVQQSFFGGIAPNGLTATAGPVSEPEGSSAEAVENAVQNVDNAVVPPHKILGEAMKTYIIVELEDRLVLIDKHAAHERMNFDRMRRNTQPIPAQQLLTPLTLKLTVEELGLVEEYAPVFRDFGFELEPFGESTAILRAAPSGIFPEDAIPAVEEILQHLLEGGAPDPAAARDELLHTVACKAAIKAGWDTGAEERETIAVEVLSGRVKYCPHGRPVSAVITRRELDRLFLRIV